MENIITIYVEDYQENTHSLQIPTDMGFNLMELLKASDFPVEGTCGGIALCASCHIEIQKGEEHLAEPSDQELDMLDTLPHATASSRLACQLRLSNENQGLSIKLLGPDPR